MIQHFHFQTIKNKLFLQSKSDQILCWTHWAWCCCNCWNPHISPSRTCNIRSSCFNICFLFACSLELSFKYFAKTLQSRWGASTVTVAVIFSGTESEVSLSFWCSSSIFSSSTTPISRCFIWWSAPFSPFSFEFFIDSTFINNRGRLFYVNPRLWVHLIHSLRSHLFEKPLQLQPVNVMQNRSMHWQWCWTLMFRSVYRCHSVSSHSVPYSHSDPNRMAVDSLIGSDVVGDGSFHFCIFVIYIGNALRHHCTSWQSFRMQMIAREWHRDVFKKLSKEIHFLCFSTAQHVNFSIQFIGRFWIYDEISVFGLSAIHNLQIIQQHTSTK